MPFRLKQRKCLGGKSTQLWQLSLNRATSSSKISYATKPPDAQLKKIRKTVN